MTDDRSEEYLWDPGAPPDEAVRRIERLAGRWRWDPGAEPFRAEPARAARRRPALLRLLPWIGALAAAAALIALGARALRPEPASYAVEGLEGLARAGVGQRIVTGDGTSALVRVASLGDVIVHPDSRVRIEDCGRRKHALFLERGTVSASIVAEPRAFQIGTPAGLTVDLGCEYDLTVDDDKVSTLLVRLGRVSFEADGKQVIVPAGATCQALPGEGPNVPVFEDAPQDFVRAVRAIEDAPDPDPALVERVTGADDLRDASLPLWHLLRYATSPLVRERAFERLSIGYPPPAGFDASRLRDGDEAALLAWRKTMERDWAWQR